VEVETSSAMKPTRFGRWRFTGTSSMVRGSEVGFAGMSWMKVANGQVVEGWTPGQRRSCTDFVVTTTGGSSSKLARTAAPHSEAAKPRLISSCVITS